MRHLAQKGVLGIAPPTSRRSRRGRLRSVSAARRVDEPACGAADARLPRRRRALSPGQGSRNAFSAVGARRSASRSRASSSAGRRYTPLRRRSATSADQRRALFVAALSGAPHTWPRAGADPLRIKIGARALTTVPLAASRRPDGALRGGTRHHPTHLDKCSIHRLTSSTDEHLVAVLVRTSLVSESYVVSRKAFMSARLARMWYSASRCTSRDFQ